MIFTTGKNEWEPKFTMSTIFKIKCEHNVDILDITPNGNGLNTIGNDIIKFFEVLYVSVEKQAKEKSIDFQSFVDEFTTGDQIDKAQDAIMDAVFPFFKSNVKDALQKAYIKSQEISEQATADICANLENLSKKDLDELVDELENTTGE